MTLNYDFSPLLLSSFLLISYLFYFPFSFSNFVHIYIFLCLCVPHLVEVSLSGNFLLQSSTDDYTSPFLLPLASTTLAGTTLLRTYHRPHVPYVNRIVVTVFLFLDSLFVNFRHTADIRKSQTADAIHT
jgi:hypothetical protein